MRTRPTSSVYSSLQWLAVPVLLAAASGASAQQVPCTYSALKIGAPICPFWGPVSITPQGLNNSGNWVGYQTSCVDLSAYVAVRWTPETGIAPLPLPPGTTTSIAADINDHGTVVGSCNNKACIWIGAEFIQIPPLVPGFSGTYAVNNSDVVVGGRHVSDAQGVTREVPFVWKNQQVTDLDLSDSGLTDGYATCVSESGIVAGVLFGQTYRGFRWQGGVIEVLGPLPGAAYARAWGVSSSGLAVGDSQFQNGSHQPFLPTIWDVDGVPQQVPLLPGYTQGACYAVNDAGVILGNVAVPTNSSLPGSVWVVWVDRVPYAIAPRIASTDASTFMPYDINDQGQILGRGAVSPPGGGGVWVVAPHGRNADLNGDCLVNGLDLAALLDSWGPAQPQAPADLNADGIVDGADLGILLGAWRVTQ